MRVLNDKMYKKYTFVNNGDVPREHLGKTIPRKTIIALEI